MSQLWSIDVMKVGSDKKSPTFDKEVTVSTVLAAAGITFNPTTERVQLNGENVSPETSLDSYNDGDRLTIVKLDVKDGSF